LLDFAWPRIASIENKGFEEEMETHSKFDGPKNKGKVIENFYTYLRFLVIGENIKNGRRYLILG
jgi:hypothetical protein